MKERMPEMIEAVADGKRWEVALYRETATGESSIEIPASTPNALELRSFGANVGFPATYRTVERLLKDRGIVVTCHNFGTEFYAEHKSLPLVQVA